MLWGADDIETPTPTLPLTLKGEGIEGMPFLATRYESSSLSSLSRCISRVALMPNWVRVRL